MPSTNALVQGTNNFWLTQNGGSTYQYMSGSATVGNIPQFNSTGGQFIDSGIAASSLVTNFSFITGVGNVAIFYNTTGGIYDGGFPASSLVTTVTLDNGTLPAALTSLNLSGLTASQAVITNGSKTLASLAYTSANTPSTLVERDSSGNFSAGTITATLTGNASSATTATNANNIATLSASTNASFPIIFVASSTNSNQAPELNENLNYNPSTGTLNVSGGGGINSLLNIGSSAASLIGTASALNFSSSLSFGTYVNLGGSGRNIGVKNDGLHFMTYNLDYNATTPGYQYSNSNGAITLELTTNGVFAISTAPSGGTPGASVSPTVRFKVTNAGLVNIPGLSASSLIQTDGSNNLSANNTLSSTVLGNITKSSRTVLLLVVQGRTPLRQM